MGVGREWVIGWRVERRVSIVLIVRMVVSSKGFGL